MCEDKPVAIVFYCKKECGEPGYYYYDEDYQDEGVCGPFNTLEKATLHALDAEYKVEFYADLVINNYLSGEIKIKE